jgi:hypothetical protein
MEMALERKPRPGSADAAFNSEAVSIMTAAYEAVLNELDLAERYDPVTLLIARRIFDLAREGERDVQRLVAVSLSNALAYRRLDDRVRDPLRVARTVLVGAVEAEHRRTAIGASPQNASNRTARRQFLPVDHTPPAARAATGPLVA